MIAFKIKSKAEGYRRAGHKFSSERETLIEKSTLSKDAITALKSDKNLLVSEIETKAPDVEGEESKTPAASKAKAKN